jgi:O-antigen/teichoic acid export membrane protein
MAQIFGAKTLGLYQIAFTTVTLLATIAVLSQDVLVVRTIAPLIRTEQFAEAASHFRGSRRLVLGLGVGLALVTVVSAFPFASLLLGQAAVAPFVIALAPAIVLLPLMRVNNALLRCLGRVTLSQSLEGVLYTTLAIVGLWVAWSFADVLEPTLAPALVVAGLFTSVAIGMRANARYLSQWPQAGALPRANIRAGAWVAAGPITGQAGQWIVLLAIAAQLGPVDAGIFRIGVLTCMLMQLIKTSFATMAGPYLAKAAEQQDQPQIKKIILVAGLIGIALASPVALVAVLFPEWVLGWFGAEFVRGAVALQLLAVGQLISVAAGPLGASLIMQKRERVVFTAELCSNGLAVAIAGALLPSYGLAGAGFGILCADVTRIAMNGYSVWFGRTFPGKD